MRSEWSRFDYYAPRIKELGYLRFEFNDIDKYLIGVSSEHTLRFYVMPIAVSLLCMSRQGRVLLPNLIRLRWNAYDIPNSFLLPAFMAPTLTTFSLGSNTIPPTTHRSPIAMQLDAIPATCPGITSFETFELQSQAITDAAIRFAYDCPRLEGFIIVTLWSDPRWTVEFLQHLARQPFLRRVRFDLSNEDIADNLSQLLYNATPHYPFPSLQKLYIAVANLRPCIDLIRGMHRCSLHTLDVDLRDHIFARDLAELFTALREGCALHTLQVVDITIELDREWCTQDDEYYFVFEDLEPLLAFHNMRLFRLEVHLAFELNNYAICSVADAWPLLVDFRLGSFGFFCPPDITWAGLAYFVWKCPQLIFVSLAWDTTRDDVALITSLEDFRPNKALRLLWAADSILVDDVERFAHPLFAIAPYVHVIDGSAYDAPDLGINRPPDTHAFYAQVETIMWELRRTRMREEFGFLDAYGMYIIRLVSERTTTHKKIATVLSEADMMNDFSSKPLPRFPYVRTGLFEACSLLV